MFEYKVKTCRVKKAEELMNEMAKEGWEVKAVSPNLGALYGVVITFKREKK